MPACRRAAGRRIALIRGLCIGDNREPSSARRSTAALGHGVAEPRRDLGGVSVELDEHQHAGPIGRDFRTAGANRASESSAHVGHQVLTPLKEKRTKHGSRSLAAERQTTGHQVEGDA
jgi:hypothetical protein